MVNKKIWLMMILLGSCFCHLIAQSSDLEFSNYWSWTKTLAEPSVSSTEVPILVDSENPEGIFIETTFTVPAGFDQPLGIILYKNNMSCKVYVNGQYLDVLGSMPPDFFFEPYITRGVFVDPSILKETNTLTIEAWNDTGTYKLRKLSLVDAETYRKTMRTYNFIDIQLPRFATTLLFFVGIYSLFLYINYRQKKESLYLSLSSFFFGLYLLNVTLASCPIPYVLLKAFLYSCFPLSIMFIFPFFRVFFRLKMNKAVRWFVRGMGLVLAAGYYFQGNTASLDLWHSIMLIYPVVAIFYGFYGSIKSLVHKEWFMLPVVVGLVIAVAFSSYDIYYFIGDKTPVILLQGLGFMSLILGTFYSFSKDIAHTNNQCACFANDLQANQSQRDILFKNIQRDAHKSESTGTLLNKSIDRVGALISQYLVCVDHIYSNLQTQSDQVTSNKQNVHRIANAIRETSQMVDQHGQLVDVTVQNLKELTEGIQLTDSLVKKSNTEVKELSKVCMAAETDVSETIRYVDDLANYSRNINEIVKAIGDLAEQTNVLSINAAIEAARSGEQGKGFAVVAGEIRSLASKSGESAGQIDEILGTMIEKIVNIQKQEKRVSDGLQDIVRENSNIGHVSEEIFQCLEEQNKRNLLISNTVAELVDTVHRISEQSHTQQESSDVLNESLEMLDSITRAILVASQEQKDCNEELKNSLGQLQTVSDNNMEVVTDLRVLIS